MMMKMTIGSMSNWTFPELKKDENLTDPAFVLEYPKAKIEIGSN